MDGGTSASVEAKLPETEKDTGEATQAHEKSEVRKSSSNRYTHLRFFIPTFQDFIQQSSETNSTADDDFGGLSQEDIDAAFEDSQVVNHPIPKNLTERAKILPTLCLNQSDSAHRLEAGAKLVKIKRLAEEVYQSRKKLKSEVELYNASILRLPPKCDCTSVKVRNSGGEEVAYGYDTRVLRFDSMYDAVM